MYYLRRKVGDNFLNVGTTIPKLQLLWIITDHVNLSSDSQMFRLIGFDNS